MEMFCVLPGETTVQAPKRLTPVDPHPSVPCIYRL